MSDPFDDPRVTVDSYVIRPSGYDDMVNSDKDLWCLDVVNGHEWGWSIRQHGLSGHKAMNRRGEWVYETRGSKSNRFRRYTLTEALSLALRFVDKVSFNGCTAAQASAEVAARFGGSR